MNKTADDTAEAVQRSLARAAATLLSKTGESSALEMFRKLGLLDALEEDRQPKRVKPSSGVGIWEPVSRKGETYFERSLKRSAEWRSWANVKRIAPKGSKKRVVLVGESVARGFFYDPAYTPSQVLQRMVGASPVSNGIEVVDCAKNNLMLDHLLDVIHAARALDPDMFVIFAGNNVFPRLMPENRHAGTLLAAVLREQGMVGLKRYFEERARMLVNDLVWGLEHLGTPVVFIIPESNLSEWHPEEAADVPWIAHDGNEQWSCRFEEAKAALRSGDLQAAAAKASDMVTLDQETAACGLHLLARCTEHRTARDEARGLYERARDAHIWDALLESPRPLAAVQGALRHALSKANIPFVDLPHILHERSGDGLPDRRFFLDYCHLTAEGIRVAMAAAAQHVGQVFGFESSSIDELIARAPLPPHAIEGEACFAAAIHCAHFGQPYDIVHHNCQRAMEASGEKLAPVMIAYMEVATRRAPSWMCSAADQMAELKTSCLDRYLRGAGELKLIDRVLFDAITDVLEETDRGVGDWLADLRNREHGIAPGRRVNLLDRYYAPSWRQRDWAAWLWERGKRRHYYYRATEPCSSFVFVSGSDDPILLRLTCRLVDALDGSEPCILSINGREIERFSPTSTWATWTFVLPTPSLKRGMNSLEIHWPTKTIPGEAGIERAARDFEQGLLPRLVPVLAAIHSLTATTASELSATDPTPR